MHEILNEKPKVKKKKIAKKTFKDPDIKEEKQDKTSI